MIISYRNERLEKLISGLDYSALSEDETEVYEPISISSTPADASADASAEIEKSYDPEKYLKIVREMHYLEDINDAEILAELEKTDGDIVATVFNVKMKDHLSGD